ncbi:Cys-tRNA(Pro) deacylase [Bdellovibrio sp. BCCA]|uniref:Cys-tRNA(Pro) deacylase n=1 Tax=Bdellovibrio sp. BCCA TaxID=3136281 RepID=UPI0030F0AC15
MTDKDKLPMTLAIRELQKEGISFTSHLYPYEEKGGTAVSSKALGVPESIVIKTLIMESDDKSPLIVLMHGDMQVSTKQLARELGVKTISPCKPEVADRHSGYQVGGTSPFGTKKKMPVYMEKTILDLERIYINGGKRGYLISLDPHDVVKVLKPQLVQVGIKA